MKNRKVRAKQPFKNMNDTECKMVKRDEKENCSMKDSEL